MHRHDVLILGSGLAALTTALKLADQRRVAIVTKRQMTLVGPRPALASEVESFDVELLRRHDVVPGITGLWQVEAMGTVMTEILAE